MKHIFTLFCFLLMAKPCLSQDIEVNIIDVSCNGNCDGQVTITASGGVAPYEYSIDGGVTFQNSNIFFNLCPGSYDVLTRDSEEITANLSIEITEPDFLDAIITVTPSGTEPSGVLLLEVFGGYLPYEYSIDFGNTYQFENTFSDLPVSTSNTVIVRDAAGCESLYVFAIEQTSFDNTLVVTGNDLTANLDALSYRWIDAETQMPIEGETNKTFTAEEPGDYRVEMTIDDSSTTLKSVNSKGQKAIITVSSPTYELATLSVTSNEENLST